MTAFDARQIASKESRSLLDVALRESAFLAQFTNTIADLELARLANPSLAAIALTPANL
jgi:hypothetical protein